MSLEPRQLTGADDSHLVELAGGHRLQRAAAEAFLRLQRDAFEAGFDLAIASSFRSFQRQLLIWNGKAGGERPVHDDRGAPVALDALPPPARLRAILRYSALPGASRHHWGTDLDVYDAGALAEGESVQLLPAEVAPGGVFDALHRWLDGRMAAGASHGFYRPYGRDRGGVAPERWHLSFAPLAQDCGRRFDAALLRECWARELGPGALALREEAEAALEEIVERYIEVPEGWCPAEQEEPAPPR
jgi:LAS superfamily LD-carboxypeptidase LdcB